jgi:hypothetical protein
MPIVILQVFFQLESTEQQEKLMGVGLVLKFSRGYAPFIVGMANLSLMVVAVYQVLMFDVRIILAWAISTMTNEV